MLNPFTEILTPQMFFVRELEKETRLLKSLTVWVLTKKNNPKIPKAEQKNPQQNKRQKTPPETTLERLLSSITKTNMKYKKSKE